MEALNQLNDKIDSLLRKFGELQSENKRLKETVARQEKSLESMTRQLASLEGNMVSVRLTGDAGDEDERANMRKQLDMVIADIDKILVSLND